MSFQGEGPERDHDSANQGLDLMDLNPDDDAIVPQASSTAQASRPQSVGAAVRRRSLYRRPGAPRAMYSPRGLAPRLPQRVGTHFARPMPPRQPLRAIQGRARVRGLTYRPQPGELFEGAATSYAGRGAISEHLPPSYNWEQYRPRVPIRGLGSRPIRQGHPQWGVPRPTVLRPGYIASPRPQANEVLDIGEDLLNKLHAIPLETESSGESSAASTPRSLSP
ncbi:uncharacterized protein LOC115447435 [Manduca sexta]|uniref:uncharacterized protein LOC115447435 n=1 Tax=Manduca sexta TaxID=7130 RepID=UPI0011833FB5|nr:uncharacterized protein LOC115447435 [Manduca sexta]XP_030030335.1 uncharacterized protein LOC115447435 [Manduca sexta]XP_030030336.1 uncharacterized protein LOC115447435 [Manduca sexta]XP_030030337.1 uncharacterized protein LOC115447435 [Manduca sexta]